MEFHDFVYWDSEDEKAQKKITAKFDDIDRRGGVVTAINEDTLSCGDKYLHTLCITWEMNPSTYPRTAPDNTGASREDVQNAKAYLKVALESLEKA